MTSPAVPLFVAAAAGAFAGLAEFPLAGLAPLTLLLAVAAVLARLAVVRAVLLLAAAFSIAATGAAVQRDAAEAARRALPSGLVILEGVVADLHHTASGGVRLALQATGFIATDATAGQPISVQVVVPAGVRRAVVPGDRIRVRGHLRPLPPAFSPGEIDPRALGLARGIDARLSVGSPTDLVVMERRARAALFARLRILLRERMLELLPPRLAGLELALLVGDTSLLDDEQRELYRRVGAGHLLAVSGLQVTLIALLLRRAALAVLLATSWGRKGRGRAAAAFVALGGVVAFVLLCGAPPSAVRAAAMAAAVLAADLFTRRVRLLDSLGLAGLATVLLSPASVLDPSFLLSYGAVLGLAVSTTSERAPPEDHNRSLLRVVAPVVAASLGAGLVTLPISAALFGEIAPAGLVANIVLVPLASTLQVPALGLGLAGALLGIPGVAWLGAQAALLIEAVAAGLGDVLPAVRPVEAPGAFVCVLLVACAATFGFALARRHVRLAALGVVGAAAILLVAAHEPAGVRITVLPVGQGDAAVFEMPDGKVMVVDGGGTWDGRVDPGTEKVLPFLRRRGIDAIDAMVLTHPHPDHALGLISVARAIPVRELWHNGSSPDGPLLQALLRAASGARVRTTPALLGRDQRSWGGATVEVLAPAPSEGSSLYPELGANDNSLVLRVCFQGSCALWPGDIESLGEELLLAAGADVGAVVVKVPHHGSRSSSTPALVRRVGARHAVFCTGLDNTFGFPHREVLERWRAAGTHVWDTAVHGELTIRLTDAGVQVAAFAEGEVRSPEDG